MTRQKFTQHVIELVRSIPEGKVATYGGIASMAGNPKGARQVVRILHTCSKKERLPWHRVLNREGRISLKRFHGYEEQRQRLENEGIEFGLGDRVDLEHFLWRPNSKTNSVPP